MIDPITIIAVPKENWIATPTNINDTEHTQAGSFDSTIAVNFFMSANVENISTARKSWVGR